MAEKESPPPLADIIRKLNGTAEAALEVQLPQGGEHYYYINFPSYSNALKEGLADVQQLLTKCESMVRTRRAAAPDFTDADDVAEWTSSLLDDALERVDTALDAARGPRGEARAGSEAAAAAGGSDDVALMANLPSFGGAAVRPSRARGPVRHAAGLARPQDAFDPPPDNRAEVPWRPSLDHLAGLTAVPLNPRDYETGPGAPEAFPHPFAAELSSLEYPPDQLRPPVPAPPPPPALEDTPLVWVDTPAALAALVADLQAPGVSELAVDLEQHGYRSFQGFGCLMQLSTRTTDYVVDTIALRNQLGLALQRVFADPRVVKVLHGADSDVEWLQRDHSLFLVNLFDTGQAARVLALQSKGLAHLLEILCGFQADKRYQLADWRLRPLSPDMLHYARCDTHFLLYVYDKLREQLAALPEDKIAPTVKVPLPPTNPGGALGLVLERSRQLCLKTYHKPAFSPDAYTDTLARWGLTLTPAQTSVFAALLAWRDRVSRAEDESPGYVLPKAQLVSLAQAMPDNAKRVQAVLGRAISEVLTRRVAEVVDAIADARHRPLQPPAPAATSLASAAARPTAAAGSGGAAAAAATGSTDAAVEDGAGAAGPAKRALPVLKPRAVVPIRTAGAKVPAAAAAAAVEPATSALGGVASAVSAAPPAALSEDVRAGAGGEEAVRAAPSCAAVADGSSAAAALKPRALNPPPVAASRSAALFSGGPAGGNIRDASPSKNQLEAAIEPGTEIAMVVGGAAPASKATPVGTAAQEGNTERPKAAATTAPLVPAGPSGASDLGRAVAAAGARPAVAIRGAGGGGTSVLGAMFGCGGGGVTAAAAAQPGTAGAAAGAGGGGGGVPGGAGDEDDDDEEGRRAAQRAKRLRATFALPFMAAPAPAAPASAAADITRQDADVPRSDPSPRRSGGPSATAADIRAAVEALREEGDVEIFMGADGRGVAAPPGTTATDGAAAVGAEKGGGWRSAPAARRIDDSDGSEDGGDKVKEGEEGEKAGRTEKGGSAAGSGGGPDGMQVEGAQLGLDVLEFVPVPLSQRYPKKDKAKDWRAGKGQGGDNREAPARRGNGDAAGAGTGGGSRKRAFVTELPPAAAGTAADAPYSDSDDSGSDSDSDGGHTVGPFAKKRRPGSAKKAPVPGAAEVFAAGQDASAGKAGQGKGRGERGRRGRGRSGKPPLTGLLADFPRSNLAPAEPEDRAGGRGGGRGGRGGNDRGGRGGRGGRAGGRQPTAFNPYDIPDEFLMKGGKRSAVMPRSGNRSVTFK